VNLGCGSSRETTARAVQAVGIEVVLAVSFARLFRRKPDQHRVLPLTALEVGRLAGTARRLVIDLQSGLARDPDSGGEVAVQAPDGVAAEILRAGGLVPWLAQEGAHDL